MKRMTTKEILAASFQELAAVKNIDKITIQEIVVPCEMEGCLKLAQDEQVQLKELLDKAIIKMEV